MYKDLNYVQGRERHGGARFYLFCHREEQVGGVERGAGALLNGKEVVEK